MCDTLWYEDVADRLVAAPSLTVDANAAFGARSVAVAALNCYSFSAPTAMLPVPSAASAATVIVGAAVSRSAICLYCTVSPLMSVSSPQDLG